MRTCWRRGPTRNCLACRGIFVGDTAETAAKLLWPPRRGSAQTSACRRRSTHLPVRAAVMRPRSLRRLLDRLDADGRYALLKLATWVACASGCSARLAKQAFAQAFDVLESMMSRSCGTRFRRPMRRCSRGARGAPGAPTSRTSPFFRPFMLAHPPEEESVDLADYAAEWKWDGIRVQIVRGKEVRAARRGSTAAAGEDDQRGFPEVVAAFDRDGVLDGELLVRGEVHRAGEAPRASTRCSNGSGGKSCRRRYWPIIPPSCALYDICSTVDGEDLRAPAMDRAAAAAGGVFAAARPDSRFDLSAVIERDRFRRRSRRSPRGRARRGDRGGDAQAARRAYVGGRRAGLWYKWKRDPLTADCVMMYAQREQRHAARASIRTIRSAAGSDGRASCCPSARPIRASPTRN